ncbi:hypothetical protein C2857_002722 [Epichloe festucae Fl1]|uniref:FAD dependent oxidoreductase domain-containing protein n=1 Tax=Epichloe festucae (strain Fl1) TaxID=877507 RepID=A0A7S9KKA1_EPIFF|nr:hypothetical protein C2857_002722 [Epichloe festucae Fl1]
MSTCTNASPDSVAVIGGGWYGCHIALTLRSLGFKVKLFEQNDGLLKAASGNNQCRLHMGYHYPRHSGTRAQSRSGFKRFVEQYSHLSRPVLHNIYAVPSRESLLDYNTYCFIMLSSEMSFSEGAPHDVVTLTNVDGAICTMERVILQDKARNYFESVLGDVLELGKRIMEVRDTDATWGHHSRPSVEVIYEPTLLLYYQGPVDFHAVTLVDGPLCSLYPTEVPGLYTLSSV